MDRNARCTLRKGARADQVKTHLSRPFMRGDVMLPIFSPIFSAPISLFCTADKTRKFSRTHVHARVSTKMFGVLSSRTAFTTFEYRNLSRSYDWIKRQLSRNARRRFVEHKRFTPRKKWINLGWDKWREGKVADGEKEKGLTLVRGWCCEKGYWRTNTRIVYTIQSHKNAYTRTQNGERNKRTRRDAAGQGSQMRAMGIHNYNVLMPAWGRFSRRLADSTR